MNKHCEQRAGPQLSQLVATCREVAVVEEDFARRLPSPEERAKGSVGQATSAAG